MTEAEWIDHRADLTLASFVNYWRRVKSLQWLGSIPIRREWKLTHQGDTDA